MVLGSPENEVELLVEISMKLGEMAISMKNNEQAINYYKEGLDVSPNNINIMVALAKLYMQASQSLHYDSYRFSYCLILLLVHREICFR